MKDVLKRREKPYTKLFVKTRYFVLITILILLLPFLFRFNSLIPGDENYLISRMSHSILEKKNLYDNFSFGGRAATYPIGAIIILTLFNKFDNFILVLIPILFGIASVLLYVKILRKFNVDDTVVFMSFLILIFSNAFLYNFTIFNFYTIPVFLFLLGFYFLIENKYAASFILFALMPFFGFFNFATSFLLIFSYLVWKREHKKFLIYFALVLITNFIAYFWVIKNFGFPNYSINNFAISIQSIVTEFNGFGVSLFVLVLSLLGLRKLWEKKYSYLLLYIYLLFLFILVFIDSRLIIYLAFILSYLSSLGLINIYYSKWELVNVKKIMMLILAIGIIFSSISYVTKFKYIAPDEDIYNGLVYLKGNSEDNAVVFSHYKNGILINSISERKNFIDKNFLYIKDIKRRLRDNDEILYSRNLRKTEALLNKYNISYIFITKDMKQGLVWNNDNEGLLFVMKFSTTENFIKIYENNGVEIWKYFG